MTEFLSYPGKDFSGNTVSTTIATGPVVVNDEHKFLLHISSSTGKYQFIGGRLRDNLSVQENAIIHAKDDLGVDVLLDDTQKPLLITDTISRNGQDENIILIHYLATIKGNANPTKDEWKWFSLEEIVDLETQGLVSSPNIRIACEHFSE